MSASVSTESGDSKMRGCRGGKQGFNCWAYSSSDVGGDSGNSPNTLAILNQLHRDTLCKLNASSRVHRNGLQEAAKAANCESFVVKRLANLDDTIGTARKATPQSATCFLSWLGDVLARRLVSDSPWKTGNLKRGLRGCRFVDDTMRPTPSNSASDSEK